MDATAPTEPPIVKDAVEAQALLGAMAEKLGREVTVFLSSAALPTTDPNLSGSAQKREEEPDDFYDFTADDYARIRASKKEEVFLKTKKIREAEVAARRARITRAIIRVQFPDNYVLEAKFQPSDSISMLIDLLKKVVSRIDIPFYLYTAPPKQRLEDLGKDFYSAGLTPGAHVYFSYESSKGVSAEELENIMDGPYLKHDVMALRDLHLLQVTAADVGKPVELTAVREEGFGERTMQSVDPKPRKSGVKPKWMKL